MSEAVLDSSVLLAVLNGEAVDLSMFDVIEGAVVSAVNFSEVLPKLADLGITDSPEIDALFALLGRIVPFGEEDARLCSSLRARTRHAGLSLGDWACLALGLELGAEVYTADRAWLRVDVGCAIKLVR